MVFLNQRNIPLEKHKKNSDFCLILLYLFLVFKWFLQKMLGYRLGTVNDLYWGFTLVFNIFEQRVDIFFLFDNKHKNSEICGFIQYVTFMTHTFSNNE